MNITTLINAMRDAIVGSATVKAWCYTNYDQAHTVYKGVDQRNPPPSTDYPVVTVFPVSKIAGYELEREEHVIGVVCGVKDETVTSTTTSAVVLKEYDGVDNLEAFRKLVETAAVGAVSSPQRVEVLFIEYEVIEFFPYLLASMEFKVSDDFYEGDDAFK